MEILIIIAVLAVFVWYFFLKENTIDTQPKAPYKIETPPTVDITPPTPTVEEEVVAISAPIVDNQITDAVTQTAPAKKPRKPRTPKAEKPAAKKAAPKKAAAMKATKKPKSKKA